METTYKHGIYSDIEKSGLASVSKSLGTIPAYIGSLPVQRVNASGEAGFDYSDYVNKPILISSYRDVEKLNLYSRDWQNYTLCEAIHAHFLNGTEVVAPIILVNMSDPTNVSSEALTMNVTLVAEGASKVGYLEDSAATIDGIAITIEDTQLVDGDVEYSYVEGERIKIKINKETTATSASVSYKCVQFNKRLVEVDVFEDALSSLDMSEFLTGYIPNIIAAPYFSSVPEFHTKMVQYAMDKISQKWNVICVSDIPCNDETQTIAGAKEWKEANWYNNKLDKVCYPMVKFGTDNWGEIVYHLSTIASYTMQRTDMSNDDVPYVSPSNKIINARSVVIDVNGTPFFMREYEANELNKAGITTVNIVQRQLRLWGSHMANYNFDKLSGINFEDRSDSGVRMALYIANMLQYDYIESIDTPFDRSDVDSVQNSIQQRFNALVNEGKLLYATVYFTEESNSDEELANGNVTFDVEYTLAPNTKSVTFKLRYTSAGLSVLTSGGEA